jgi:tape measure domain-containing protein
MALDYSIAISAKDNYSQAITTMRNANQRFSKDLTGIQTKLNELNKTKAVLKVDTDKAKEELEKAERQFAKTRDAASKLQLELANAKYENADRNLSLVKENLSQTEVEYKNLTETIGKSENKAGAFLGKFAKAGGLEVVGDVALDVATTWIGSAYGSNAATVASSTLSTAAMGASIGTAIAPGIGTAIGALGGAVLGYIKGQNEIFKIKDEAFKGYYKDLYDNVLGTQSRALSSGSGTAAVRETDRITYTARLGTDRSADAYLESLTQLAVNTPFEYEELKNVGKTLLDYQYSQNGVISLLKKVGDAGSALGMSTSEMASVATTLGQMKNTDQVTIDNLNPLLEKNIPVWDYLAMASGKTKEEVQEMVSKGLVPGEKAAKAIADYMGNDFAGNMDKQGQTYSGLTDRLEGANTELNNAMGEGYNSTRKEGLQEQIDWLSGDSGVEMQDAYNKIGQWKASLENLGEQYQRDAIDSVMSGTITASFEESSQKEALERLAEEYKIADADYNEKTRSGDEEGARKAGAEMGRILAETQAIATNEYNASDGAQLALNSNKTLAENIKNDTVLQDAYWDAGYTMSQQFTLGYQSGLEENEKLKEENNAVLDVMTAVLGDAGVDLYNNFKDIWGPVLSPLSGTSHAAGLSYVPYNNYPARLHEGERVLTASENRNYGKSTPVTITGNTFVVREDGDIKEIAKEIANLFNRAYVLAPQ